MQFDRCGLVKVGTEPEQFLIALLNSSSKRGEPFMSTSAPLEESALRDELKTMGFNDGQIDLQIEKARQNPR